MHNPAPILEDEVMLAKIGSPNLESPNLGEKSDLLM